MAEAAVDVFLQSGERRDFALLVEGSKVYVERAYLASWSPVLRKIFFPEGEAFKQPEGGMVMKEKKLEDFLIFLHAVFPIEKTMKVNDSNVAVLVSYADEYDVRVLRQRCVEFMGDQLKEGKVVGDGLVDYLCLASLYNLKDMQARLVPHVAQLTREQIEAAHETLPVAVLAAIYQCKSNAMARMVAPVDSPPTLPEGAFWCWSCGNTTCTMTKGASSCCGKSVRMLATAAAQVEAQCSFNCAKCSKPCSLQDCVGYSFSSCCGDYLFIHEKSDVCQKRPSDAATAGRSPNATDFSANLLAREK